MRYRGPKAKVMRRFGVLLANSPKYARILEKRPTPPGQHGARARRGKIGAYGSRLNEKQKLRAFCGIAERQMRRYVPEATRRQGPTGTNLLQILEQRLDAVVARLGFAPTIWAARQLVAHGHVLVNGKRVDIPSFEVRPGHTITVSEKMKQPPDGRMGRARRLLPPAYLELDRGTMTGRLAKVPDASSIARLAN